MFENKRQQVQQKLREKTNRTGERRCWVSWVSLPRFVYSFIYLFILKRNLSSQKNIWTKKGVFGAYHPVVKWGNVQKEASHIWRIFSTLGVHNNTISDGKELVWVLHFNVKQNVTWAFWQASCFIWTIFHHCLSRRSFQWEVKFQSRIPFC